MIVLLRVSRRRLGKGMGSILNVPRVLAMKRKSAIEGKENKNTDPLGGLFLCLDSKKEVKMENNDKKMLREISNDTLTPKKHDFKVENDLYERNDEELGYDDWSDSADGVPLTEF